MAAARPRATRSRSRDKNSFCSCSVPRTVGEQGDLIEDRCDVPPMWPGSAAECIERNCCRVMRVLYFLTGAVLVCGSPVGSLVTVALKRQAGAAVQLTCRVEVARCSRLHARGIAN